MPDQVRAGIVRIGERRIVTVNGWTITQIRLRDGSWWNITAERVRG